VAKKKPSASAKAKPSAQVEGQGDLETRVEEATQDIGRYLFEHLHRRKASIFEKRWWEDRILSWAIGDEAVKVQMFRFVDVLPRLKTHVAVTQHLQEYFEEVSTHLPGAARLVLDWAEPNTVLGRALAVNARSNASRMAQRFIAGSTVEEVTSAVSKLRKQRFGFTLDLLGEATISGAESDAYQQQYLNLISGLAAQTDEWPEDCQIDNDHLGPIPRVNVSLKLSALCSHFRPIDPVGTTDEVLSRLRPILRAAREHGAYVHVDMEQFAFKDLTLDIFQQVLMEAEFRDFADVGIVIQAYLSDAESDLQRLLKWSKKRGTPVTVRLVKGAYWDYETVLAGLHGWPVPVFQEKWQSDANFEKLARLLMENYQLLRPALASHNLRSLANGIAWARQLKVPIGAYEIQMLYGMAAEQAQLFAEMGHRVRIYTPFGELIPGMAYLVRRLLENTSNDSFLRHSLAENVTAEDLFAVPESRSPEGWVESSRPTKRDADDGGSRASTHPKTSQPSTLDPQHSTMSFRNEPPTDFSQAANRKAFQEALDDVKSQFGNEYPLVINGRVVETKGAIVSISPSHRGTHVGKVSSATKHDAQNAIAAAKAAFPGWSRVEPKYRAEHLNIIAQQLSDQRLELAAWIVHEVGKTWEDADGDVAEAIDFCRFYAEQMLAMSPSRRIDLAGEENEFHYRPRGVVAVIAPWNFPLAILSGMTVAALAMGNTVVMKPAEQSSVVAAKFMDILMESGLPDGVVNFLPGIGEEVGPALVQSPDVDVIAFTGSRTVGLEINKAAAAIDLHQHGVKRVIAEMGGKNAIIVDDDADLDEAVLGVVQSAFGYAGQKCSACSRVIVLAGAYDQFLERLKGAVQSLKLGPAEDPGTFVPPVIDSNSRERINEYIELGKLQHLVVVTSDVPPKLVKEGHYVAPHVFADVPADSRLAQEEIFGPVLCVLKAKNLDEALMLANGTDYALTGGLYSRSPQNLARARREFQVGNLYLNRPITGALVNRQPFGGFKLSGIGTKAGGADYLMQFVVPISVTENTLRRGFAPKSERAAKS
jgi:RHH-type proline utilization regulon transcriptional repressor/proline dehydrogenase/delta 1-pyrroline-5-carboxylate dehydrogenase